MRLSGKQIARIFTLAWAYMTAFLLPYVQYTFYTPIQEGIGATHEQLGNLLSMYAIICLFAYIPGGWVADRYSLKKILIISMVANVALCVWMGMNFTYTTAVIVWGLCAFTSGAAFWAALIKGVGLTGTSAQQGKVWGLYEFGDAILAFIVSYVNLFFFATFEETLGIRAVFFSIAGISVIAVILLFLFFEDVKEEHKEKGEKTKLSDIIKVFKVPAIWFVSFAIMCNYIIYAGMTYFTPYLEDVLGLGIVSATGLVIFRSNGLRAMAGPTFGTIADRKGSVMKTIIVGMLLTAIFITIFIFMPSSIPAAILIGVFFFATFTLLGSRGLAFACLDEIKIPNKVRGLAVAIVSMIAYTPDLVIYKFYGSLLDNHGNDGYTMIFTILIGLSVATAVLLFIATKLNKKSQIKE